VQTLKKILQAREEEIAKIKLRRRRRGGRRQLGTRIKELETKLPNTKFLKTTSPISRL